MSSFLGLTPCVRVILDNVFLHRTYPADGTVNAVIDTGYEGFVCVPDSIFEELELDQLQFEKRRIALADGNVSMTKGFRATLRIPHLLTKLDGFVETFSGLDEIILGVEAVSRMKLTLDYCTRRLRMEKCR